MLPQGGWLCFCGVALGWLQSWAVLLGSCLRARVRLGCGLIPKHQWGIRAAHLLGRWEAHCLTMHSLASWRVAACMHVTGCMPVHPITQQTASLQAPLVFHCPMWMLQPDLSLCSH